MRIAIQVRCRIAVYTHVTFVICTRDLQQLEPAWAMWVMPAHSMDDKTLLNYLGGRQPNRRCQHRVQYLRPFELRIADAVRMYAVRVSYGGARVMLSS